VRRSRRLLAAALGLAFVAAAQVADEFEQARRRLESGDPAGAAELLSRWCARHPDDANGWLALGVSEAQAGRFGDALRALPKARAAASRTAARDPAGRDVSERASFDLARVLFEKAQATPRAGVPGERRPESGLVADVRTRLALIRFELETARDLLIDLADAAPRDGEARRGLAAVSELLRTVVAEDRQWREKGEPPQPQQLGQGAPASGPLKPGPSGAKSSSGADGKKSGEAGSGANPATSEPTAGATPPWIAPDPLRPDEEASLDAALRRIREERERADERRAEAQARARATSSW
jgi:hypothetical protein